MYGIMKMIIGHGEYELDDVMPGYWREATNYGD